MQTGGPRSLAKIPQAYFRRQAVIHYVVMASVQIEHFFLGCLAHASYLVGSEGAAAVIDPQRDVEIYLETARERGWKIQHIIETHLHADFVSGHHELAERTGAQIYLGEGSGASFLHTALRDGDSLQF